MSQQDFNITTADANTGITYRAAVNVALQALASSSSGASEPATKYPFQFWADTTNDLLKMRNEANNAWITVFDIAAGRPSYIPSAVSSTEIGYLGGVTSAIQTQLNGKQANLVSGTNIRTVGGTSLLGSGEALVSGTNIRTINSTSILGSGNIDVQPTLASGTNIKTINSTSILGSGNITVLTSVPAATSSVYGGIKVYLSGTTLTITV